MGVPRTGLRKWLVAAAGALIAALVASVPSGSPTQPDVYSNICPEVTGAAGQIVPASQNGPEDVRYQGDGAYSISVTATPAASGDIGTNCGSGPTTTGTFTRHHLRA